MFVVHFSSLVSAQVMLCFHLLGQLMRVMAGIKSCGYTVQGMYTSRGASIHVRCSIRADSAR